MSALPLGFISMHLGAQFWLRLAIITVLFFVIPFPIYRERTDFKSSAKPNLFSNSSYVVAGMICKLINIILILPYLSAYG